MLGFCSPSSIAAQVKLFETFWCGDERLRDLRQGVQDSFCQGRHVISLHLNSQVPGDFFIEYNCLGTYGLGLWQIRLSPACGLSERLLAVGHISSFAIGEYQEQKYGEDQDDAEQIPLCKVAGISALCVIRPSSQLLSSVTVVRKQL